ncbi:hypothetical protein [Arthrobacter sp. ISL-95]|uniref:hypothetical protein n=1 Tax=Arthrobacter sp. ISL-95 TaxID=2819116 RepID=UPI001BEA82E1|nr:hypothetical protein [Arthrobacter sp. ISL-95]MBT2585610.1 hypothetical protein [Arthrobacter sp. ISL-95]
MNNRHHRLAALALASLLLPGCAANAATAPDTGAEAGTSPSSTGTGHANGHHGQSTPQQETPSAEGPSEASLMVCGDQPMERLTSILKLDTKPHTINDWADSTFTCTYHLDQGALKISVKEAKDKAAALTHFNVEKALAKDAKPIEGLANLGFPAYETAAGSAVFQKDSFVLHVDASGLPATVGPENITRNALAYQLSTTILACWIEHP